MRIQDLPAPSLTQPHTLISFLVNQQMKSLCPVLSGAMI